jgi:hypothetical protein
VRRGRGAAAARLSAHPTAAAGARGSGPRERASRAPPLARRPPLAPRAPPAAQCFQRISALACRAAAYFLRSAAARQLLSERPPGGEAAGGGGEKGGGDQGGGAAGLDALECLLLWLSTYSDLFSRPCSATGKLLCWEPASAVPLPPVVRPFK